MAMVLEGGLMPKGQVTKLLHSRAIVTVYTYITSQLCRATDSSATKEKVGGVESRATREVSKETRELAGGELVEAGKGAGGVIKVMRG